MRIREKNDSISVRVSDYRDVSYRIEEETEERRRNVVCLNYSSLVPIAQYLPVFFLRMLIRRSFSVS